MATKAERFPKEFINAAMLKGKPPLVLTILEERYEPIEDRKTGKTLNKSVLYFEEIETKLILNGTNFDLVSEVTGSDNTEDWPGHTVELHVDKTRMGGDRVDCVRVRAPSSGKPAPTPKKRAKAGDVLADEDAATLKATLNDELPPL
jgi:hypothetical protein